MRGNGMKVLIVGAGIAGLGVARALREWGAEIDLVDRAAGPELGGTGIYLPANAVRALGMLGLEEQVVDRACRIDRQRVANQTGRVLYEVDTRSLWGGVAASVAARRADLHRVLLGGVDGLQVRYGRSPLAVEPRDSGATVEFDDATRERYDLVIGADGVRSAVRRLVFGDGGLRPSGLHARRFLGPRHDDAPVWSALLGRGVSFLTIPLGPDEAYYYCDTSTAEADRGLTDVLAGFATPAGEIAGAAEAVQGGPVEEVVLDGWSRGHILLLGDAAHATPPNMAQGAAMALEDALVLAQTLDSAGTVAAALRAYEARRRPRVEWAQQQTRKRDRARAMAPVLRDVVMGAAGERMFRANYRQLIPAP